MKSLDWLHHAIAADWSRKIALGRVRSQRFVLTNPEKVRQAQRDRARALLLAMGMKIRPSDDQVARMIEVLGPLVPGLTIQSPLSTVPTPPELGVTRQQGRAGRPPEWPPERLRQLMVDVDALRAAGRADSDADALILVAQDRRARGDRPPTVKTLANRLAEARTTFG